MIVVDMPTEPGGSWRLVAQFKTKAEAVAWIRDNIGNCDEDGKISFISEVEDVSSRGEMGIFEDYEGCDSGIDTKPEPLTNGSIWYTEYFKTLKEAEAYQMELYSKFDNVKLLHAPRFSEDGKYVWEVK
jgi:hypothetical protein